MLGGADCRNCGEYASTVPVMRMAAIAATTGARLHIERTRGGSFRIVNALAASVVRDTGVALILMHNRGRSTDMYQHAQYSDVAAEVRDGVYPGPEHSFD